MKDFESQNSIELEGDPNEEVLSSQGDEDAFSSEDQGALDTEDELEESDVSGDDDEEGEEEQVSKKDYSHRYKAAMKEERQKRQELQRRVEDSNQKIQKMEETFTRLQQHLQQQYMQQQQQQLQQQIPSFEENPVGYLAAQQELLKNHLIQQQQQQQQQYEQAQEKAYLNRIVADYKSEASEYVKKNPDFGKAYDYIVQKEQEKYQALGYSPQEAHQMLIEDELAIVAKARKEGKNPAELIYNAARKAGYQGERSSLDRVDHGMKSNRSLGSVSGESRTGQMTLEQLSNMDPSDPRFDKYWNKFFS